MKLSSLICQDCSRAAVLFNSKKRILEFISQLAHDKLPYLSQQDILSALMNREKLGSTGIGRGIAIPHGRMSGAEEPLALVLVSETPINFDAIDNRPVDIFVALIVPDGDNQQHLKTLATIADKLNNKDFCKQLRSAKSDTELYQVIVEQS
ncbi:MULTISPECIES: PTS IIA-like nitrogen regulatory protein PtsN [Pseudoalteromonas]|uniref:PTS IIA-like nitrogen-regulatory protein PtsN n=1 Tax=Pseudoalteromonas fuliginea TaxID=1872678 RepID=A0A063KS00_9GAMM|nr:MULTISPECIES: PTS IIA-like nitrogen regulatory protein PtsN [Pseudoalteromonas]ALQ07186.1 PTS cellobiose transporter subunit IIA [Pseudoalteromonas sp. Bsw20308]ATG78582.1 PTS cellobiose transporter subunit IIA [Pseudoalteromonas sp. 1_2015MBL_MicDiv]KAA1150619.1 PTS IIA-like nitrogen-regulatory protein PtsN [Pseudoalteromonas fuliginea]KAA1158805.1 PTS IIA-like nitrogen-regulatory protein PtsN [Pseudoalteromonas fuliginea]KAA1165355.1 PTS IIA-like nitrogen-regulatory protein PtsN [Pseudoal